jgi:hypothetical protein
MADPAPAPATPPADPAPADPPATDPPTDPAPSDDGKGGKDAILADLAAERDKRQGLETKVQELQTAQQSQLDAIAKALGLKSDDTPPDPEKLTADIQAEQARAREAQVQLAVYRGAAASGGNPDALLDSASFLRSLAEVDPGDPAAVATAIKAAVEANPRLAAQTEPSIPTPGQVGLGVGSGGAPAPTTPQGRLRASIQHDIEAGARR